MPKKTFRDERLDEQVSRNSTAFIPRQQAMDAYRDIVSPIPLVRLSKARV